MMTPIELNLSKLQFSSTDINFAEEFPSEPSYVSMSYKDAKAEISILKITLNVGYCVLRRMSSFSAVQIIIDFDKYITKTSITTAFSSSDSHKILKEESALRG